MKRSDYPTSVPAPGTVAPIIQDGKAQPIEITNAFASGGLMSTPEEMARLAMVFTNDGKVGRQADSVQFRHPADGCR